jgi:hypothetical protein
LSLPPLKNPNPLGGGAKLAIISCTLPLSIEPMEVLVIVFNTQVKAFGITCHSKTYTINFTKDWSRHKGYFNQ